MTSTASPPDPAPGSSDPSTPPDPSSPPTLRESAALVGAGIWFERRGFEVVGAAVAATPEPRAKAVLATVSRHHAWRADQLAGVLATTHDLAPDDVIVPAAGFAEADLDPVASASTTGERVRRLDELLGRWRSHLVAHRDRTTPIADGPLRRVLDQVVADLDRDRADLADLAEPADPVALRGGHHATEVPPDPSTTSGS